MKRRERDGEMRKVRQGVKVIKAKEKVRGRGGEETFSAGLEGLLSLHLSFPSNGSGV